MADAVADLIRDGDTVAIEGFTHLISFAAGHEIIRQGRRELTLARLTPDLVYDQMVAAGCASKLIFSWLGNPGVGGLHAIRRRVEADGGAGPRLELEEYSHFGMVGRYTAGAADLPFFPLRSYFESDLPAVNPMIREVGSPFDDQVVYAVPPLRPDVTVIHAQRASANGDVQVWGLLGCQKEAAFAAERVIAVVEELVDDSVIRADPNRTLLPGLVVDAVVVEPWEEKVVRASRPRLPATRQVKGQHVLLVEDNQINLELAREVLLSAGLDVSVACNGKEALEKLY